MKAAEGSASETDRRKGKKNADADEKQWSVSYCKDFSLEPNGEEVQHDVPKWLLLRSTPERQLMAFATSAVMVMGSLGWPANF